ncbi:MAG: nucleotidyltransferase family protein, partial [Bacteroidales bacterium]|nr:nucleotidyltransferase family protein [Bacteroidales bacterium]
GTLSNETRLGAVRDLILALEACGVDEDVRVVAADNILEFSLRGFVEEFRKRGTSMIMCHYEPELRKLQRTGVIEVDEDMRVLQMQEKPEVPVSHWAVPPFYIYRREDLGLVRHSVENGCGADAPGNLARYLVLRTPIHAWPMPGPRFDIGSLDTYEEAKRRFGAHLEA